MLKFREAEEGDMYQYYVWTNEHQVRLQSFDSNGITWEDHESWFTSKLNNDNCLMFLFYDEELGNIGQVRFEITSPKTAVISISIDPAFRGKSLGADILILACRAFWTKFKRVSISAYIKKENFISRRIFEKAGFKYHKEEIFKNFESFHFINHADR